MDAKTTPPRAWIEVGRVQLRCRLGWEAWERATPQEIEIALRLGLDALPRACHTDELADTVCYADLIERMRKLCAEREFRLVERLAWVLAEELRPALPSGCRLDLRVTKLHPPVPDLTGGVAVRLIV